MSSDTIFGKIIRGEVPTATLHADDRCIVIQDIHPQAPFHALVIPKKPLVSLATAQKEDEALLGHCLLVARQVAEKAGCGTAFRVVSNAGEGAGQSVAHLHFHVLGGRPMKWPPG